MYMKIIVESQKENLILKNYYTISFDIFFHKEIYYY